jgi:hypothetical protein
LRNPRVRHGPRARGRAPDEPATGRGVPVSGGPTVWPPTGSPCLTGGAARLPPQRSTRCRSGGLRGSSPRRRAASRLRRLRANLLGTLSTARFLLFRRVRITGIINRPGCARHPRGDRLRLPTAPHVLAWGALALPAIVGLSPGGGSSSPGSCSPVLPVPTVLAAAGGFLLALPWRCASAPRC